MRAAESSEKGFFQESGVVEVGSKDSYRQISDGKGWAYAMCKTAG